jgi:glycosyltransferase involved in cell wall biosynthesis
VSDRIKILYVSPHSEFGGGESSLLYLLKFLDRERYYPVVLIKAEGTFSEILKNEGIEVEIKDIFYRWRRRWWMNPKKLKKSLTLYRILKKIKPHIIHSNTFEAFLSLSPVSSHLKIPTIATVRGFWEVRDYEGLNYAYEKATLFHLTSRFTSCLFDFPEDRTRVIGLGIDVERFKRGDGKRIREEIQIGEKKVLIGVVGRFSPEKGQHIFVEAFDLLIRSDPSLDIHALMVGSSIFSKDKSYRERVIREVERRGLREYFSFFEFREDIPDILHALDILVIPSRYEMPSRIAQEGAAAGVPVIATDCGEIREVVIDGVSGFLFRSGDPHDLMEKMKLLLHRREMRLKMGERAREVAKKFDAKVLVKEIEELYEGILKNEIQGSP